MLNDLLARGGLTGMLETVALILVALVREYHGNLGFLEVLLERLMERVEVRLRLVGAVISPACSPTVLGDQYLALSCREECSALRLKSSKGRQRPGPETSFPDPRGFRNLTSVLVHGIPAEHTTAAFSACRPFPIPYAFLNYLNPLVALP